MEESCLSISAPYHISYINSPPKNDSKIHSQMNLYVALLAFLPMCIAHVSTGNRNMEGHTAVSDQIAHSSVSTHRRIDASTHRRIMMIMALVILLYPKSSSQFLSMPVDRSTMTRKGIHGKLTPTRTEDW